MYTIEFNWHQDKEQGDHEQGFPVYAEVVVPGYGAARLYSGMKLREIDWSDDLQEPAGDNHEELTSQLNRLKEAFMISSMYHTRLKDICISADILVERFSNWWFHHNSKAEEGKVEESLVKKVTWKECKDEIIRLRQLAYTPHYKNCVDRLRDYITYELEEDFESFTVDQWTRSDMGRFEMHMREAENWMRKGEKLNLGSVRNMLDKLKSMLKHAYDQEYTVKNVAEGYDTLNIYKRSKEELSAMTRRVPSDLLKKMQMPKNAPDQKENYLLWKYRIVFLIQTWTGMSWADLWRFDWDTHVINQEGKRFIQYYRQKTGELAVIPLFSSTKELFSMINYEISLKENEYPHYKLWLKNLSEYYGAEMKIRSHDGRHCFAQRMKDKGVDMATLSRMMGHKSIVETERTYGTVDAETITHSINRTDLVIEQ